MLARDKGQSLVACMVINKTLGLPTSIRLGWKSLTGVITLYLTSKTRKNW
jgi:hypothetical protein